MKKFTMFIGLNDKDAKVQRIATETAVTMVNEIVARKTDGATVSGAKGVYRHEDGTVVIEETVRVEMFGVSREAVVNLAREFKKMFNQESILLEEVETNNEFI